MSRCHFDTILKAPTYKDKFHEVHPLMKAWQKNMGETFSPSWVACLDKLMSAWTEQYSCPGCTFIPRKPHPCGNKYHMMCCGDSGILMSMELCEGKHHPCNIAYRYSDKGSTVRKLLQMCEPIFGRGMVVIMDSSFCVLQALIELKKKGVYALAVIKKRRYWPKHVDGDSIEQHMEFKQVGDMDATKRLELDGVPYKLFCMKETDYTMKLMATYGALLVKDK